MNYGIHVDPVRLDRIFSFRRFWTVVCCTLRNQEMNVKCVTYEIGMVEIIHYLLRVDHSSRGIVPSVVCLSVIIRRLWYTTSCCDGRGGGSCTALLRMLVVCIRSYLNRFSDINF